MGMESRFLSGANSSLGLSNPGRRDGLPDEASSDIRMRDERCSRIDACVSHARAGHRALPQETIGTPYEMRLASCVRDLTSSFRNAFRRWYSTVLGLMNSCAAISRFVVPCAARRESAPP